mmetsp:Transcript_53248/g.122370  ORF Transcript_53248/g.122370 Transcript_53248/m.122370 type:complete len:295 (+) Transcript_53248:256-1140(+)
MPRPCPTRPHECEAAHTWLSSARSSPTLPTGPTPAAPRPCGLPAALRSSHSLPSDRASGRTGETSRARASPRLLRARGERYPSSVSAELDSLYERFESSVSSDVSAMGRAAEGAGAGSCRGQSAERLRDSRPRRWPPPSACREKSPAIVRAPPPPSSPPTSCGSCASASSRAAIRSAEAPLGPCSSRRAGGEPSGVPGSHLSMEHCALPPAVDTSGVSACISSPSRFCINASISSGRSRRGGALSRVSSKKSSYSTFPPSCRVLKSSTVRACAPIAPSSRTLCPHATAARACIL